MKMMSLSPMRIVYHPGLLVSLIFGVVVAVPVRAQGIQADTLTITTVTDQERITVGDAFQYIATVISPVASAVRWPETGNTLGGFDILDFEHDGPHIRPDGAHADTLRYTLTVYQTGVLVIPPLSLSCVLTDGSEIFATSDSIPVTVVSVIDDEAVDIRDLKKPADIPLTIAWYIWAAAAVVLLLIIGLIWYLVYRRRKQDEAMEAFVEAVRPPHEQALDELDQLARFQWLAQGRVKTHYSAISEILRRYLSARYHIAAMEFTTTELMHALRDIDMSYEDRQAIKTLLEACDMVKFAKYTPDPDPQSESIEQARHIIEQTRQREVPQPESNPKIEETTSTDVVS